MTASFYLKYRPQRFQDLDSASAREELIKIFKSGRFPHAFLFSGTKGIGKTSAARIVAKAVNCEANAKRGKNKEGEAKNEFEPCNQCSSCLSITSGSNIDVLEIDAASNRGIEDIKDLREKIKLAPASAKYKVYIIDEAHMLTTEAFNALLKTLEEPPPHALFILCTTDPEKLPKTIISRCQQIKFKKATEKEIIERLIKNCREENLEYEEEALGKIAKLSEGSFRDAVKLLDQASLSGKITTQEVEKVLGISGDLKIEDFLGLMEKRQTKEALSWIDKAINDGVSLRLLTENLLERLRILLLGHFGIGEIEKGFNFSIPEIKTLIELFTQAYYELKSAVIPSLPLELAVIKWDELGKKGNDDSGEKKDKDKAKLEEAPVFDPQNSISFSEVVAKWPLILEKVKPLNHSVQALLKSTRPVAFERNFLILEVFYKFHKDQLETEKCRRIFEKTASEVLGTEVKLKCSLSENQRPINPPPKLDDFSLAEDSSVKIMKKENLNSKKTDDDDIIRLAEEIFNKNSIN